MNVDTQGQRRAQFRAPWLVLGACLILLLLANHALYLNLKHKNQEQFQLHVDDMHDAISQRLRRHEQILLGAAGFFDASNAVSRAEWKTYVERLRLEVNYPGIQGVGYSQIIQPSELAAHVRAVRAEGFPAYVVRPPGPRDLYTSIVYLEPFRDRNLAAFGYDMFSEPTRNAAMRQAGETGAAVISAKVRLVQETHGKPQAGFLMYVPVYHKGLPLDAPAERWRALRGFVYSPYRMEDLMRGARVEGVQPVSFRIFDGVTADEEALMYDAASEEGASPPPRQAQYAMTRAMQAYGHAWTVNYQSRPDIEVGWFSRESVVLLVSGGAFSVMLFVLIAFLSARRAQAEALARAMTAEIRRNEEGLRQNEARLNEAQRTAQVGSWELDLSTGQLHWSNEIFRLFEIDKARFPATYEGFLNAIHPDDREAVNQAYTESLEKRQPYEITHRLRMADGRIKWVHERCTSDFDAEGRPLRSRGTVQDITRQTEVERAVMESAQFAQSILDHAVDGIITIDEKGMVQSFNKAAERIFGYSAEEVAGRNVNILMPEPYHSAHDGYLARYAQTGVKRIIGQGREVEGRRKDGRTFPMDLAVSHVARQGRPLFVGLVRDITERKRVDRMKSEFVSTVSHE
ncbi:MAG: CHASE domain-containing protein, partial [Hylemonella sp.]